MHARLIKISLWLLLLLTNYVSLSGFAAERYNIDPQHTFATFEYNHFGLSMQHGRFDGTSGFIEFDQTTETGEIMIEIDATSINTGVGLFDKSLRSSDFFDAEKYPKIRFTSSRLIFDGDNLKQVEGELTIKDITRAVTLELTHFNCRFMLVYGKRTCGANGFVKILRSDYRMGRYAPFVGDEVTLYISVEAIKEY